jgi:hypothetical protein
MDFSIENLINWPPPDICRITVCTMPKKAVNASIHAFVFE